MTRNSLRIIPSGSAVKPLAATIPKAAGKSTLMNILGGVYTKDSGTVKVNGVTLGKPFGPGALFEGSDAAGAVSETGKPETKQGAKL
jgi:ABC-type uncharacterized transport system ATPase subunit